MQPISCSGLDYNQLKLLILRTLSNSGSCDSGSLAEAVAHSVDPPLDIHALRMALMRYHKQGLLKRERAGGIFHYTLTERGVKRLQWLEEQTNATKH